MGCARDCSLFVEVQDDTDFACWLQKIGENAGLFEGCGEVNKKHKVKLTGVHEDIITLSPVILMGVKNILRRYQNVHGR